MAALLGHKERGEKLLAELERARARLAAVARKGGATALVVERGGYTQGPSSLAATLLAEAGLKPPAGAPAGYGGFIPLEKFLVLKPDLVFLKDPPRAATDQGAMFLVHPAMRDLYPPERRVALPTRYTMCGGPALVAAFDYMADEMAQLPRALSGVTSSSHDRRDDRIEPVGQRGGTRLQDQRRFDLAQPAVAHRRDGIEARRAATFAGTNFLPHQEPMMMSGAAAITASGVTMRSVADFILREFREDIDAAGDLDQFRHPADAGNHRLVPFLEIDARLASGAADDAFDAASSFACSERASASALSCAPTSAPSVRIIAKMPAMSRWLKACTSMPARISCATISACRSEKVRTRSGSSARIFGTSALMKAETRGFSLRTRGGRTA